jgi:hypothetical protein
MGFYVANLNEPDELQVLCATVLPKRPNQQLVKQGKRVNSMSLRKGSCGSSSHFVRQA